MIGAGIFTLYNKHKLCSVDYCGKFQIVKKAEDLSADSVILVGKDIFFQYGLPKKIMSVVGGNFISDNFKQFYKNMNIEQAT